MINRLQYHINVIENSVELLSKEKDIAIVHTPELGILCLRFKPVGFPLDQLDQLHQFIFDEIKTEGKRAVSLTKLDDKKVLRIVVLNQNVTPESILQSIADFRSITNRFKLK